MSDKEPMQYEGLFTRYSCPMCASVFDTDGDARGEKVKCEDCGYEATIEGN